MEQQNTGLNHFHKQGLFFLVVGSVNALVHFLSLIFFVQVLSVQPFFANIIAFIVAFTFGFVAHLKVTFQSVENKEHWTISLKKWFMSSIFGFLLNQSIFALGIYIFGQKYYIAVWFVATGLVTICTFILAKFWAFKGRPSS